MPRNRNNDEVPVGVIINHSEPEIIIKIKKREIYRRKNPEDFIKWISGKIKRQYGSNFKGEINVTSYFVEGV